jgi:flagellar biosynthesis protein FlhG
MNDQAQKLRELAKDVHKESKGRFEGPSRVITITSGKGGVGKTSFTLNIGLALASQGYRVTIIDADFGLANVDVLIGMVPKYNLVHLLRGEKELEDILLDGPSGIKIVTGASGVLEITDLSKEALENLIGIFTKLENESDFILIDTGAGINKSVISFIEAVDDIILIVNPDPTSITDSYAVIKNIKDVEKKIHLVINRVESNQEGKTVFNKLSAACKRFLNIELINLGYIYEDLSVRKAVKEQSPFYLSNPKALATKNLDSIANNIIKRASFEEPKQGLAGFLTKLFNQ